MSNEMEKMEKLMEELALYQSEDSPVQGKAQEQAIEQIQKEIFLLENDGYYPFSSLFKDGVYVPTRVVYTKYGKALAILADNKIAGFVSPNPKSAAKKGYTIGLIWRKAKIVMNGNTEDARVEAKMLDNPYELGDVKRVITADIRVDQKAGIHVRYFE